MAASSRRSRRQSGACGRVAFVASSCLPVRAPLRCLPSIHLLCQPHSRSLAPLRQSWLVLLLPEPVWVLEQELVVSSVNPSCVVRTAVAWLCVDRFLSTAQTD
jgi:hypothetical protein